MNFRSMLAYARRQRQEGRGFEQWTWDKYQNERLKAITDAQDANRSSRLNWFISVDLGKAQDPTAMVVGTRIGKSASLQSKLRVEALTRWKLGTPYMNIVADLCRLVEQPALQQPGITRTLVVDGTGVGAAVVEMIRAARFTTEGSPLKGELLVKQCRFSAVYITPGKKTRNEEWEWYVPKLSLVECAQVSFEQNCLMLPPPEVMPAVEDIKKELMSFRFKKTAANNVTAEAWRDSDSDDLVLALSMFCFMAQLPDRSPRRYFGKEF